MGEAVCHAVLLQVTQCASVLMLAANLLCGCRFVRGHEQKPGHQSNETSASRPTGDPWVDGKLPASVSQGEPRDGGELVFQIDVDPPSLNTIVDSDYWAAQITSNHIYESLVTVDPYDEPRFRYVPALARSWEVSPDGRVYTFHLREDVRWHDGSRFSAADVVATFDKIQDTTSKAAALRSYTQGNRPIRSAGRNITSFLFEAPLFSHDGRSIR